MPRATKRARRRTLRHGTAMSRGPEVPIGLEGVPPALLAAWRREHVARAESGPEFLTTAQLQALWGVGRSATGLRLRRMARAGRIERGLRRAGTILVPAYRLRHPARSPDE